MTAPSRTAQLSMVLAAGLAGYAAHRLGDWWKADVAILALRALLTRRTTVVGAFRVRQAVKRLSDASIGAFRLNCVENEYGVTIPGVMIDRALRFVAFVNVRINPSTGERDLDMVLYERAGCDMLPAPPPAPCPIPSHVYRIDLFENVSARVMPVWMYKPNRVAFLPHELAPGAADAATRMAAVVDARAAARYRIKQATFVLCGPPGTGKSTSARVLAHACKAVLCESFVPGRAGHVLSHLLSEMDADADEPGMRIVLVDEIDLTLRRLVDDAGATAFGGSTGGSADACLSDHLRDRSDWNRMLDYVSRQERLIVIFTTNLTPRELRALDGSGSMLRQGRVHAFVNVGGGAEYDDCPVGGVESPEVPGTPDEQ